MNNRQIALIAAAILAIQKPTSIDAAKAVIINAREFLKFLEYRDDK